MRARGCSNSWNRFSRRIASQCSPWDTTASRSSTTTINLFVQVNPAGIGFKREGDRWKAEIDIVYVQKDERGRLLGDGVTDTLTLALTDANYAKAMKDGLIRQHRIPRQAAATNMRIVVRDVGTGSVGSLTIPFSQIAGQPQ